MQGIQPSGAPKFLESRHLGAFSGGLDVGSYAENQPSAFKSIFRYVEIVRFIAACPDSQAADISRALDLDGHENEQLRHDLQWLAHAGVLIGTARKPKRWRVFDRETVSN
jgi:hypothetical protein